MPVKGQSKACLHPGSLRELASLSGEHYCWSALGRPWLVDSLDKLVNELKLQRMVGSTSVSQLLKSVLTTVLEFSVAN